MNSKHSEVSASYALSIQGITKIFGTSVAVGNLWLDLFEGEFFSLLGPSGCGKTTTLRMLAGFEYPDSGRILLRGVDCTSIPPDKRNTNLVFQHYELFPHMTVFENVAYGLRLRKIREPELSARVREALAVVRCEELEERGVNQISGGQQQRVALARAIVNRPAVLLLDEPLSALDVKLRKKMQLELKRIQHQLGTTFVYVTHDQEEALLLSDRIGIMNHGGLLQVATPRQLYMNPADSFVAEFVGSLNIFNSHVVDVQSDVVTVQLLGMLSIGVPPLLTLSASNLHVGDRVRFAIRPERVQLDLWQNNISTENCYDMGLRGQVSQVLYLGGLTQFIVTCGADMQVLVQRTSDRACEEIFEGAEVVLTCAADAGFVLPPMG